MDNDAPTSTTASLYDTIKALGEDVVKISEETGLTHEHTLGLLNIWLNYDVTLRQMEMAAMPPPNAIPLSREELQARLREAAENAEPTQEN